MVILMKNDMVYKMSPKKLLNFCVFACLLSYQGYAQTPGVGNMESIGPEEFQVTCVNGNLGKILKLNKRICAFSDDEAISRCKSDQEWTFENAAEFLCSQ